MYEEVINYIRDKDNFSSTIFYDILADKFMLDCHTSKKVEKVMKTHGVKNILRHRLFRLKFAGYACSALYDIFAG